MRFLKIAVVLLTGISFLQAAIIEKTFRFSQYRVDTVGNYQVVRFAQTLLLGDAGKPVLPYHALALLLPPGESVKTVEIIPQDEHEIPGTFRLLPGGQVRPLSSPDAQNVVPDPAVYQSNDWYPSQIAGQRSVAFMNGHGFLLSVFTPLRYRPQSGKLTFYSRVTFRVQTQPDSKAEQALKLLKSTPEALQRVNMLAQNKSLLASYSQSASRSSDDYQLLVITDARFQSAFDSLRYLYLIRGIKMKVIPTDSIYRTMSGNDHQEAIRNFIIQEYQNHSVEYVLLGGDVEWVPYRGFYCVVQSDQIYQDKDIPADLYYSALDGTWNDDGDDKWGEIGEDDLLPDVAVARLPFSSEEELQRMLHKIVSYQDHPVLGELNRPLLAGEKLWDDPLTWGGDYMDLLVGYHEDNGYTTLGIPPDDPTVYLYDRDMYPSQWSGSTIMQQINQGRAFVYHAGHANTTYALRLYSSDITDDNFAQVDGITHNFTLVNTQGCYCGAFDAEDCIAEEMLKINHFAVGFVGNSRYGWFNEGTTEGPSTHLQREFVNALYKNERFRIGQTHMDSKIATAPWVNAPNQHEEGAMRWCFYDCNVLSDPALGIWTEEPITVQADYPHTIQVGSSSMEVQVTSDGQPVPGLTCALLKDSVLYGSGVTDSLGRAEIQIDPPIGESGAAQLFVSGYNCLPTAFPVSVENASAVERTPAGLVYSDRIDSNYPNPFNSTTKITVYLHTTGKAKLSVFDIKGRKVKTLLNGWQSRGVHSVFWNGSDETGRPLSSGTYFVRLQTPRKTMVKKLLLLK